jgi:hypothetical protein
VVALVRRLTVLLLVVASQTSRVEAQAVQAIKSIGDEQAVIVSRDEVEGDLIAVAERKGLYQYVYDATSSATGEAQIVRERLRQVVQAAQEVIEFRGNRERFRRAIIRFNEAEEELSGERHLQTQAQRVEQFARVASLKPLGLPVPGIHTLLPNVVFTIGPELHFSDRDELLGFGLSTNLLGASVGSVFDVLGSNELKEYFTKNISAGTALPVTGTGKLSAQIGLGLGAVDLKKFSIWPVLNIEQTDTADARVPTEVVERRPDKENWSSPIISFALVPWDPATLRTRLEEKKLVFVPVVGLRLPYYYPSDPFSALAALFSDNRRDFEDVGDVEFILGVSVPLVRIAGDPKD